MGCPKSFVDSSHLADMELQMASSVPKFRFVDKDDLDYAFSKGGGPALDLEVARSRPLDVQVAFRKTSVANVLSVEGLPSRVLRGSQQISTDDGDFLGILLQRNGRTICTEKDHQTVLHQGELTVWHGRQKLDFHMPDQFHKLCLIVPREQLEGVLPDSDLYAGVRFSNHDSISKLIASWLESLGETVFTSDEQTTDNLIRVTVDMLAAALLRDKESHSPSSRTTLFDRIKVYVDKRLNDSELSPASIAQAHHISVRYLHLIFSERGLTVGGWVRMRRLEQCRAALMDKARDRSITEIALHWGFSDAAHFSRLFKASFGSSPKQFRGGLGS